MTGSIPYRIKDRPHNLCNIIIFAIKIINHDFRYDKVGSVNLFCIRCRRITVSDFKTFHSNTNNRS